MGNDGEGKLHRKCGFVKLTLKGERARSTHSRLQTTESGTHLNMVRSALHKTHNSIPLLPMFSLLTESRAATAYICFSFVPETSICFLIKKDEPLILPSHEE